MATVNANGATLYYKEAGSGEPLLLITGTGFNADIWDAVFEKLAQEYRTIVYDRRGYQRSRDNITSDTGYASEQGEDVAALLKALDAYPATLLGWSAGGMLALYAAVNHPDTVKRLILYEPPLYATRQFDARIFLAFLKLFILKARHKDQPAAHAFVHAVLRYHDGRNSYEQLGAEMQAKLAADSEITLKEVMSGITDKLDTQTLSTRIKASVTLLVGDQSPRGLLKSAKILSGLLHCPIDWLPGANHLAHVDRPEAFVQAVKAAMAHGKS